MNGDANDLFILYVKVIEKLIIGQSRYTIFECLITWTVVTRFQMNKCDSEMSYWPMYVFCFK